MNPAPDDLVAAVRARLEMERAFGLREVPVAPAAAPVPAADRRAALAELEKEFKNCVLCGLSRTRTQVVFGTGSPEAALMFVGEAPGFDEDQRGEPFVGQAGQLLTRIIAAMGLRREDVYIANCLKCRPPNNRSPLPTEIVTCKPILLRQIEIIRPRVLCALGKFAAQTLLQTEEPISRLRGKFREFEGAKLMPTFHPAYLLRNPGDKKLVWQDMQLVMKELGRL